MSRWTHEICTDCWVKRNTNDDNSIRVPVTIIVGDFAEALERCCFCGRFTTACIPVHEDPATVRCEGNHEKVLSAAPDKEE